ncbi:hypothetical protein BX666DRAFT_1910702 [Dichotomocladium elegans]|nr:hypothetical protein BX666DRAFT_1910702 [Dichotomocladium elegans]
MLISFILLCTWTYARTALSILIPATQMLTFLVTRNASSVWSCVRMTQNSLQGASLGCADQ